MVRPARALGTLLLLLGVLVPAGGTRAQGIDETCVLALTKLDQGTTNILYPDDSARYYAAPFVAVPGTEIRIHGAFPHARYMSFNVYDGALRPVDALADAQLAADPGSLNPFLTGADRTAVARAYAARISFATPPPTREANTLYSAGQSGLPNPVGLFVYRIYIPDDGRDEYGGVGLPTAEVVAAGSGAALSPSACAALHKPELSSLNDLLAQANSIPAAENPATATGRTPPHWRKFVNILSSLGQAVTDNPLLNNAGQPLLDTLGGSGGFLSNRDNAYVAALTHRGFGQVLVTRMRAPTFPGTRHGATTMAGGQLRYWSMCQNDPLTERVVACLNDDRSVLGTDGFATFVVSAPNQRPANATRACGVNWLPWGANPRGVLIYRNMLPLAAFGQSIQRARPDHEAETMGDYFPVSRYYADARSYEGLGCPASRAPSAPPAGAQRIAARCVSHRRFRLHLPRSAVAVRVDGHRVRVRRHAAVIDLRGRAALAVRVTIRLRSGRTLVRRYHLCRRHQARR